MGKILLLIILAAVAVAWYRARLRAEERGEGPESGKAGGPRPPEQMVSCAQCAVHLPASEAVFDAAGTAFCGAPHLEAHRAKAGR